MWSFFQNFTMYALTTSTVDTGTAFPDCIAIWTAMAECIQGISLLVTNK